MSHTWETSSVWGTLDVLEALDFWGTPDSWETSDSWGISSLQVAVDQRWDATEHGLDEQRQPGTKPQSSLPTEATKDGWYSTKCIRLGFEEFYPGSKEDGFWKVRKDAKTCHAVDSYTQEWKTFEYHTSEFGWNLPANHPRHIFNFPAEILERIMSFVLVAPVPITPLTVTCNWRGHWKRHLREPCYRINDFDSPELPYSTEAASENERWLYDSVSYFRAPIDATLLRVNKYCLEVGHKLLYSKNTFEFDLESNAYAKLEGRVRNMDSKGNSRDHSATMPHSEELQGVVVQREIQEIMNKRCPEELPDWIYCDPFMRFLYSIGSTNACCIRHFRITGVLGPSHRYSKEKSGSGTSDVYLNLSYYLKAYSPFLGRYCQNLETLTISAKKIAISSGDSIFLYYHWADVFEDKYRDHPSYNNNSFDEDEDDYYLEAEIRQFDELQPSDEHVSLDDLYGTRKFREEMRFIKRAELLLRRQNRVMLSLRPLLEEICPNLKNLRSLEVRRPAPKVWTDYHLKYNEELHSESKPATWKTSIPLDFEDIQQKIAIAVYKRRQELIKAAKAQEEMEKSSPRKKENTEDNSQIQNTSLLNPSAPVFTPMAVGNHISRGGFHGSRGGVRGGRDGRGGRGGRRGTATHWTKRESKGRWGWSAFPC